MLSLLAQSLLTVACNLEQVRSGASTNGIAAIELPVAFGADDSGVSQDICTQCGGFTTPSGCCAHGIALSQRIPELPTPKSMLRLATETAPGFAQDSTSDLFRPPIRV